MPTPIPLQDAVVYGPIRSRRLGSSLGINILPLTRKVCSSNCVYCQYGWTQANGSTEPLKRAPELLAEIAAAFERHAAAKTRVDSITLAGNGEPTLHPDLDAVVIGLKRLRDDYFPGAPVGILTDATQLPRPHVRRALERLDARYLKFDAADEATWRRVNEPLIRLSFEEWLRSLRSMPHIVLQSLFMQGTYDNTDTAHVDRWIKEVQLIQPLSVQVYTVDRPTAANGITAVSREQLQAIAEQLTARTGISAEVFD